MLSVSSPELYSLLNYEPEVRNELVHHRDVFDRWIYDHLDMISPPMLVVVDRLKDLRLRTQHLVSQHLIFRPADATTAHVEGSN